MLECDKWLFWWSKAKCGIILWCKSWTRLQGAWITNLYMDRLLEETQTPSRIKQWSSWMIFIDGDDQWSSNNIIKSASNMQYSEMTTTADSVAQNHHITTVTIANTSRTFCFLHVVALLLSQNLGFWETLHIYEPHSQCLGHARPAMFVYTWWILANLTLQTIGVRVEHLTYWLLLFFFGFHDVL